MARDAGLVLIGPNCMGLYNPSAGVRFAESQAVGFEGDVVFLSQSGGLAGDFAAGANAAGVPIHSVLSFGNGAVLHHPDYLEYFADDEDAKYIALYIEGMRGGERFMRLLRKTAARKPVVLWKGGLTEAGSRATASHTASLAGAARVWEAVAAQTGAIPAKSTAEMLDILKALRMLAPFTGDGMGLTGGSGGQSVAMADTFSRAGLRVPALTRASYDRLSSWFSVVGASYGNPIDLGSNRAEIDTIMDVLATDANVDCIVMQFRVSQAGLGGGGIDAQLASLARCKAQTHKPIAAILHTPTPYEDGAAMAELDARLREIGVPSFASYERAANAIAKVRAYYRFRGGRRS
jgi:acyl-CoA synthetase (NDP forming)